MSSTFQIRIRPDVALVDEEVEIRLSGFEPNQMITVRARMDGMPGMSFDGNSLAVFRADSEGNIDISNQCPMLGTYSGVDPMGLFWSMDISGARYYFARSMDEAVFEPSSTIVRFTAEVDGKVIASAELLRRYVSPDVIIEPVKVSGFVAQFFYNPTADPSPGVIVLGGGEGGLGPQLHFAALFASHGFPTLALPYFRFDCLPAEMQEIPLEYFEPAIRWMQNHPSIRDSEIVLFGRSKGAELGLLLGSVYPQIRGVIASSPSSVVCVGNIKEVDGVFETYSSWSHLGRPLPYVKWSQGQCREVLRRLRGGERIDHIHLSGLTDKDVVERTTIPVERINGPILLISSEDDHWWPSTLHAERIIERLAKHQFPFPVKHLSYPRTGHVIRFPYIPTTQLVMNGGTAKNNAYAAIDSWSQIMDFLKDEL